ncbi:MAG: hypothetical protein H7211_12465 [Aquabacterium sp.]|nr:hypothetical protein [Ferruginibacter sp.]
MKLQPNGPTAGINESSFTAIYFSNYLQPLSAPFFLNFSLPAAIFLFKHKALCGCAR